jgi:hypothetical protein
MLTPPVFRDFEQVQNAEESRLARQFRSNIRKSYRLNRIDLNLAFFHRVARADCDVGTRPDSYAASDFSAAHSLAKPLRERHEQSLRKGCTFGQVPISPIGHLVCGPDFCGNCGARRFQIPAFQRRKPVLLRGDPFDAQAPFATPRGLGRGSFGETPS